jgi:hypothetical protein
MLFSFFPVNRSTQLNQDATCIAVPAAPETTGRYRGKPSDVAGVREPGGRTAARPVSAGQTNLEPRSNRIRGLVYISARWKAQ